MRQPSLVSNRLLFQAHHYSYRILHHCSIERHAQKYRGWIQDQGFLIIATRHGVSPKGWSGCLWGKHCIQQIVLFLDSIALVVLCHACMFMGLQQSTTHTCMSEGQIVMEAFILYIILHCSRQSTCRSQQACGQG